MAHPTFELRLSSIGAVAVDGWIATANEMFCSPALREKAAKQKNGECRKERFQELTAGIEPVLNHMV